MSGYFYLVHSVSVQAQVANPNSCGGGS